MYGSTERQCNYYLDTLDSKAKVEKHVVVCSNDAPHVISIFDLRRHFLILLFFQDK